MPAAEPERVVREFLGGMGPTPSDVAAAVQRHLTDDCVWRNPGAPVCRGKREILALMPADFARLEVRFRHLVVTGDTVLCERIENMLRPDGSTIAKNLRVMAAFEVEDGRIREWRDYFDITDLVSDDPDGAW